MKKEISQKEIKRILVVNLGGIGDILLSTPALKALRRLYPNTHIALLTIPRSRGIVGRLSYINEIFVYETGWKKSLGLIFALRRRKFDMMINMRTLATLGGTIKIWLLFFMLRPKYKVGRDTKGKGFFLNVKVPETYIGTKHDIEYNMDIIKMLGGSAEDKKVELNLTKEDMEFADNFLKSHAVQDSDIIVGISPGAPWPTKRWPLENFAKVIDFLSKSGYKIIIMGSKEEKYLEDKFKQVKGLDYISAIGETDIGQFAALIKKCAIHITNDTGAMHIAIAVGTPVVAIFGPSHIERFDPRNISDRAVVLYKRVECSPCNKKICDSMKCLKSILPEEVIEASLKLLKSIR